MKKNYLLVLLLLTIHVSAQVSLSYATHCWQPGDTAVHVLADTVVQNPGPGGPNQTWNFSTLIPIAPLYVSAFVSPSSTNYASTFPAATCTAVVPGLVYYTGDTNGLSVIGSSTPVLLVYSDPRKFMAFPFSYGDTYSDTHSATSPVVTCTRSGTTSVIADGWGTLVLPTGSYNVLRVKSSYMNYDTLPASGVTMSHIDTVYRWYTATDRFPILEYESNYVTINQQLSVSHNMYYNGNLTEIRNRQELTGVRFYPNPTHNALQLSAELPFSGPVTIGVIDAAGREVLVQKAGEQPPGEFTQRIDISRLSRGFYLLRVTAGTAVSVQKLVIE